MVKSRRIRIVDSLNRVRRVNVREDRLDDYAPIQVTNPKTGREVTAFVKTDDSVVVRESSLAPEEARAAGIERSNILVTVTGGSEYDPDGPNSPLFADVVFQVVIPEGTTDEAGIAFKAALESVVRQSGLPLAVDRFGIDVEGRTNDPIGVRSGTVRLGPKPSRLKRYGLAADQTRAAFEVALGPLTPSKPSENVLRRLRAEERVDRLGRRFFVDPVTGKRTSSPDSVVVVP